MADVKEKINSSSDSETCIDEIKAEDYNFYVLNDILSRNIILQNYLNEEGTVNALQESFMNFTAPSDSCEILSDSKQVKSGISLTSTLPPDLEDKSIKNEFQGQSQRVSLKDTFLEDVLSTSTKSFIERVSRSHINKKKLKKTLSHCVSNGDRSANSNGSPSGVPCSPAVSMDTDLKNSASSTVQVLNESYTNTSPSSVTLGTRTCSEEEKKDIVNLIGTNESKALPQKRKEKSYSKNSAYSVQKKVKMFPVYSDSSSQNVIKSGCSQELNSTTIVSTTTIRDEKKSIGTIAVHQTDDKNQQTIENLRENSLDEAQTLISNKSSSSNYAVISDLPSDDFEWSMENLELFGLALPEDSNVDSLTDKTESSNTSFSCFDTCPYGCRDLMSSEHLYHLHLAALKLSQKQAHTSEIFQEPTKCKNEVLCHIKSNVSIECKGKSRSHGYQQNENAQEKNIKIRSDIIGSKSTDVVVDNTDSNNSSSKVILNGIRRETILKDNIKLCGQVTCQLCEKSEHHMHGKPPAPVHCVTNPGNKTGVPLSISCSNIALSSTSVTQGLNNSTMASHKTALSNNSFNISLAPASSHFYKPSAIYGFGNLTNENYIQLEPFTMPNGSVWFGKQAQPLNRPFGTTNVSPHVMNSPWYQQWFHAMSMRRPLASQVSSTPCNYYEPLKMNHYRKTLWGTPNVGQQRMFQRTSSTMGSLPRMFQTPFLHSCFPATISCGDYHTDAHVQYTGQEAEKVAAPLSSVSMETNQESNFEEPAKS
ncbi:uncharacterized protein LOC126272862 isoform X2 [Schistocerca gregaria]|uniref:uncharacterized protein LOC126272862 isoform X2 n=1 Tax=Schistocerca gregaria TaxID=7010 RepID=UPI00211E6939|nr:uncharacterized protein LOC126272862 isoform X2 [Schistocerca gregaria]XP_049832036.1 uncharacterized protein LOC126272862 isoform X2 [Schistocerca gregaria]